LDADKRIVFVGFDVEATGGISTYSRYQIKALREQYSNVKVYTLDKFEKKHDGYSDVSIRYSSKAILIKLLFTLLLRERTIDLIVFNHVNLSFLGAILKKISRVKYIIFGYNTDILVNLEGLYKFGLQNSDALVIDCMYTIDRLNEFHDVIPATHLLYDPIDSDFFRPIDLASSRQFFGHKYNVELGNKFVITTVALMRETANKGHRLIIDALKKINNKDILYLVASGGQDKKYIEEYAAYNGIREQVVFLGYVENEDIPHLYNSSDVVALISKNEYERGEGVPLGLIEAASCGVAILAGSEDGSLEAISEKHPNGFSVNPRDIDDIAGKIKYYVDNPVKRKQHGENGRKLVNKQFAYCHFRVAHNAIIEGVIND
jgi:glycosyltransferase involved in cell wall biosynthesis